MDTFLNKKPLLSAPILKEPVGTNPISWSADNKILLLTKQGASIVKVIMKFPNVEQKLNVEQTLIVKPYVKEDRLVKGRMIINAKGGVDSETFKEQYFQMGSWSKTCVARSDTLMLCLVTDDCRAQVYIEDNWQLKHDFSCLFEQVSKIRDIGEVQPSGLDVLSIKWTETYEVDEGTLTNLLLITKANHLIVNRITFSKTKQFCLQLSHCLDLNDKEKVLCCAWKQLSLHTGLVCVGRIDGDMELYHCNFECGGLTFLLTVNEVPCPSFYLHIEVWDEAQSLYVVSARTGFRLQTFLVKFVNESSMEVLGHNFMSLVSANIVGMEVVDRQTIWLTLEDGTFLKVKVEVSTNWTMSFIKDDVVQKPAKVGFKGHTLSPTRSLMATLDYVMVRYDHLELRNPFVLNIYQTKDISELIKSCAHHSSTDICLYDDVYEAIRAALRKDKSVVDTLSTSFQQHNVLSKIRLSNIFALPAPEIEKLEELTQRNWTMDFLTTASSLPQTRAVTDLIDMLKCVLETDSSNETIDMNEKCPICGDVIPCLSSVKCVKNHWVQRCARTNLIIPDAFYECSICTKFYHPVIADINIFDCLFCHRILQYVPTFIDRS